jgi:hypothetical protein
VTTTDHPDTPEDDDAMAAATIEATDVGETPTTPPPAYGRRDPRPITEPNENLKGWLQRLAARLPQGPEHPVPDTDDLDDWRRDTYRAAWANSLKVGQVADLAGWTVDQLAPNQYPEAIAGFVGGLGRDGAKRNLVLAGHVGTGKTAAAIAAGNMAADAGHMVRYVRHSTYLKWLRPEGSPRDMEAWQIERRFRDCALLILDDLAGELDTDVMAREFVRDKTLNLVGDRIDSGKATIITTNQSAEAITTILGDALISRISKNGARLVVAGEDRRGRLSW